MIANATLSPPRSGQLGGYTYSSGPGGYTFRRTPKATFPKTPARTAVRTRFSFLTKYYANTLPSGVRANWESFAIANQFIAKGATTVVPANGIDYFLNSTIPVIEFSTGDSLNNDPLAFSGFPAMVDFDVVYGAGQFIFNSMASGMDPTGNDKLFLWATSKQFGDSYWKSRKQRATGFANITIPAAFTPFSGAVPDSNAGIRTSGEVIRIGVVPWWSGIVSGWYLDTTVIVP